MEGRMVKALEGDAVASERHIERRCRLPNLCRLQWRTALEGSEGSAPRASGVQLRFLLGLPANAVEMAERMYYTADRRDEERDGKKEATKENAHGGEKALTQDSTRPER